MRANWGEPGFDYTQNIRLAMADDQLLGYIAVFSRAPYVRNFLFARTHPAHRRRGIGTTLTQWGEGRVAEQIALAPPSARVTVGCDTVSTDAAGAELLLELGYQQIRSGYEMKVEMASPPPLPLWPAGITVRSMRPNQEEESVFRAVEESFRDHWGHVEQPFAEHFAAWLHHVRNHPAYDPDFFLLAMDGDEIAGFALCFPKDLEYPDMGWVNWLGVRRPWRRRGLALALLHHTFGACYRRGIQKVGLGVDASSLTGATRLYEKAGMQVYRQWDFYQKELRAGEDLTTQQLAD
jgi:mycothiol synthase